MAWHPPSLMCVKASSVGLHLGMFYRVWVPTCSFVVLFGVRLQNAHIQKIMLIRARFHLNCM